MERREPSLVRTDGAAQSHDSEGVFRDLGKTNKVVRVSFSGGLIGILFGSTRGVIEKAITRENKAGWNLAEVIPDNPNLLIWLVRFLILVLTLGLWTLSTGYILVFERPR